MIRLEAAPESPVRLLEKPVSHWQERFLAPLLARDSGSGDWRLVVRAGVLIEPQGFTAAPILDFLRRPEATAEGVLAPPGAPFWLVPESVRSAFDVSTPPPGVWPWPAGIPFVEVARDLAGAIRTIKAWQAVRWFAAGVILTDPCQCWIGGDVEIAPGVEIHTGVVIAGASRIGRGTSIAPHCVIENARVGERCTLLPGCVIRDSDIADQTTLGPYCHLREHTLVREGAKVGNFVELKKTDFGAGAKAMHLSYLGDATVGSRVNVGAGTITCNYDGTSKHPTVIEDGVFIGSGTELVAPLTVRRGAYVGAGSTLTEDVPAGALAIARSRQRNVPDWVARKKRQG